MRGLKLAIVTGMLGAMACGATPTKKERDQVASTPQRTSDVAPPTPKEREGINQAMSEELERSMAELRFEDYEAPYFIAYQLKEIATESLSGKFGSLVYEGSDRSRYLYTEVRVGDYAFDNYANIDNESYRFNEHEVDARAPLDAGDEALKGVIWQLTDAAYKQALSDYLTKKGGSVYATDEKTASGSFSKEPPQKYRGAISSPTLDRALWRAQIEAQTRHIKELDGLIDASMDVSLTHVTRYLVNSEGADIIDDQAIYSIQISAMVRAEDGMALENGRSFYARTASELPDEEALHEEVSAMIEELDALRRAPVIDPYTGPAIMMPEASGVLFHEAVGHRLEGERQRDEEEGRTFKGQEGKRVIPEFLSVVDDPTLKTWEGEQLNGFYVYDDQGVLAERAPLIEQGVLKGYLKSRTPIEGSPHSNGHGRAQGLYTPMARMANLVVTASEAQSVPYAELKRRLMEETRRQGKPYGLVIRDITGGSTNTSGYGYQAFKGASRLIYRVDPDSGEETLVRGAELVGTPLVSINKIVAASQETGVFNGYCGAESGYVPVSTVAPALLTTELELQRVQSHKERPPLLKAPWESERPDDDTSSGEPASAAPTGR